ncbi:MAG: zinc ribbon domain-containing protein [Anaerolineae bacterium]
MKQIGTILILCLAFLVRPGLAQEAPELSSLEIALWPEFDRPDMLIIYQGFLAPETALPVAVELRIPAGVGEPSAVAYVDETGQRFNQQYTTRIEGDERVVSFELATQGFQLEYYDPLPVDDQGRREYTFGYVADYPITLLSLEVQVPPTAENFQMEPPADSVVPEADGLTYHVAQAGALAQGESRNWTVRYDKADADLTVSSQVPSQPTQAPSPAAQGGGDSSTVLLFLVAFLGLAVVGAGAFWLGQRTQPAAGRGSPSSRPQKRRGGGRSGSSGRVIFCHKCGAHLRSDSDFCHKCGAAVRTE